MARQVTFPALVLAASLAAAAAVARADIVELTNGGTFEGEVTGDVDMVRVRTASGSVLEFERFQVREVRKGGWREEYLRRREASTSATAEARYQLALWCSGKGLAAEHEAELRAALAADPAHPFARGRLDALKIAREPPAPPAPPPPEAVAVVPGALVEVKTEHATVTADGGEELARKVAEIAEGAVADFARVFELPADARGLKSFQVPVRYYAKKSDYLEARRAAGGGGGNGFFSMLNGCHVSCESDNGQLTIVTRQSIRHEVAHAMAIGVLGIGIHRPWLAEALATAMEGSEEDGLGGGMVWTRLFVLGRGQEQTDLTVSDLLKTGSDGKVSLADYGRAWSFAHFIFYGEDARRKADLLASRRAPDREAGAALGKTRKETFLSMLADIRAQGLKADVEAIFDKHFPDRPALEAAWQSHVKTLIETRLEPLLNKSRFMLYRVP